MNTAFPRGARHRLIEDLVAPHEPSPSTISTTVLAEAKTEWRAAEKSYYRSLLFAGTIYVLAELVSAGTATHISIFGIEDIDPQFFIRCASVLLSAAFYWAVASYALILKLAAIHYEVASEIHPSLGYERLYEAIATPSLLTRGTTTSEVVDKTRSRGNVQDLVQVGFPNIAGFFLIPLVLLALCARALWIDVRLFGFDLWTVLSILVVITIATLGVLRAAFEFDETVDKYDMPEYKEVGGRKHATD
jgi:hypothetical protein